MGSEQRRHRLRIEALAQCLDGTGTNTPVIALKQGNQLHSPCSERSPGRCLPRNAGQVATALLATSVTARTASNPWHCAEPSTGLRDGNQSALHVFRQTKTGTGRFRAPLQVRCRMSRIQ